MPNVFDLLGATSPGHGGEIQLTDALAELNKTHAMYAYEFDGVRYDAGDKLGYLKAIVDFALANPKLGEPFMEHLRSVCEQIK